MPSVQLQTYMHLRASGAPVALACEQSGIGAGEAELWEADIASGEVVLPLVCAPAPAPAREDEQLKEGAFMARDNENVRTAEQTVAADELRLFIERIERLKEEVKGLNEDVADVYTEAKSRGYDKWAMRECIKRRALEPHVRQEQDALLETYRSALGIA